MANPKFIIITPARDEAEYLGRTIESVVSQSLLPSEWVIVDDGSMDDTAQIAANAARLHPWIKVVSRRNRGYRDVGGGSVAAFYEGLAHISLQDYEFLFNLDADIVLPPKYFQEILAKFAENPGLGIASGWVYDAVLGDLQRMRTIPEMGSGAARGWRRQCFQEIGGLVRASAWECLDSMKAAMLGWQSCNFEGETLRVIHLRHTGSSDKNLLHGWARYGRNLYFSGAHPIWVLAGAVYHMLDRPYVLSGICSLIGYLSELLKGSPRYEDREFRRFLRRWQLGRLSRSLRLR